MIILMFMLLIIAAISIFLSNKLEERGKRKLSFGAKCIPIIIFIVIFIQMLIDIGEI